MTWKNIMRGARPLILMLCLSATATYLGVVFAQERGAAENVSPRQFGATLQNNSKALELIAALYSQIEAGKSDQDKNKLAAGLERNLDAYAKAILGSMNTALGQAQLSVRSEGKQGSTDLLKAFEDQAKAHEIRLKGLDARAQKIRPKDGSISPPAGSGKSASSWQLPKRLSDFFISAAEAAIAASVYTSCHQQPANPLACSQAVANGVTQTAAAHNTFNSCWNGYANRKPAWWRAFLRGSCVAALVARLA